MSEVKITSPNEEFLNYDIVEYPTLGSTRLAVVNSYSAIDIATGSKEDQKRQLYWLIGQLQTLAETL